MKANFVLHFFKLIMKFLYMISELKNYSDKIEKSCCQDITRDRGYENTEILILSILQGNSQTDLHISPEVP
jgi:hypothetical protein